MNSYRSFFLNNTGVTPEDLKSFHNDKAFWARAEERLSGDVSRERPEVEKIVPFITA
ncbi:MAG: hypothetical protein HRU41_01695 [Saprospiraceae bacterium]|nr:hypothetical protein [Saprospiraceae bacterium]